jgi:hypothetical protein
VACPPPRNKWKNWPLKPPANGRCGVRPSPAQYCESVHKDPRAGATAAQIRQRRLWKFRVTCYVSPAAAASGSWKSRLPMPSDCMAATRSGRTSHIGCSTTPANSAPADMKMTGADQGSRRRSLLRICRSDLFARGCLNGRKVSPPCRAATARPDERARPALQTSRLVRAVRPTAPQGS